jgi:hypothetical protein
MADPPRHQDRSLAGISVITNNREDTYESTGIDAMRRQSAGDYAVLLERRRRPPGPTARAVPLKCADDLTGDQAACGACKFVSCPASRNNSRTASRVICSPRRHGPAQVVRETNGSLYAMLSLYSDYILTRLNDTQLCGGRDSTVGV